MSDSAIDLSSTNEMLGLATEIVTAYVSNNRISSTELPEVIKAVYSTLNQLSKGQSHPSDLKPAVPIKKSYTADYIICLEDGKRLKMMKRYLRSQYDMSPEEYRTKWGLPASYPMVAPNYAAKRSEFAKQIGLGRKA